MKKVKAYVYDQRSPDGVWMPHSTFLLPEGNLLAIRQLLHYLHSNERIRAVATYDAKLPVYDYPGG